MCGRKITTVCQFKFKRVFRQTPSGVLEPMYTKDKVHAHLAHGLGVEKQAEVEKAPGCNHAVLGKRCKIGEGVQREEGQRDRVTVCSCLFQGCGVPQAPPRGNIADFNTRANGSPVGWEDLRGVITLASCND